MRNKTKKKAKEQDVTSVSDKAECVETVAFICEPVGSRILKPIQNQPCSLIQPQAGLGHCGGPPTQIYRCRALCVGRGMECGSPVGSRPGAWLRCSSHSHSTLGAARLGCVYLVSDFMLGAWNKHREMGVSAPRKSPHTRDQGFCPREPVVKHLLAHPCLLPSFS